MINDSELTQSDGNFRDDSETTQAVMRHVANAWAWAEQSREAQVAACWGLVAALSLPLMMVDGQPQCTQPEAGRWVFTAATVVATMQNVVHNQLQHPLHRTRGSCSSLLGHAAHMQETHTITHITRHREVLALVDLGAAWELLWVPGLSSHLYASVQAFTFLALWLSVAAPHVACTQGR